MERVTPHTYEQRFVGETWRCLRCTNSVLFPSPELIAQLAEMAGAKAAQASL